MSDQLDKLHEALTDLTTTAKSQLFTTEKRVTKKWCQTLRDNLINSVNSALVVAVIGLSGTYWQYRYQSEQVRKDKVAVLKDFLPHLSPDVIDAKEKNGASKESTDAKLDDESQFQDYRRYVQGSDRRYAALVSLSAFDDRNLLLQMAVQYPKEGLALVISGNGSTMTRNEINDVIMRIASAQRTSMIVLDSQVENLKDLLDRGYFVLPGLKEIEQAVSLSHPFLSNRLEDPYRDLRLPVLRLQIAVLIDSGLRIASDYIQDETRPNANELKWRLRLLVKFVGVIVKELFESDQHITNSLGNLTKLAEDLDSPTSNSTAVEMRSADPPRIQKLDCPPPSDHLTDELSPPQANRNQTVSTLAKSANCPVNSCETFQKISDEVNQLRKVLINTAAHEVDEKLKKMPCKDDDRVALIVSKMMKDAKTEGEGKSSFSMVAKFVRVLVTASDSQDIEDDLHFAIQSLLRMVTDRAAVILERTKRHRGWLSKEVTLLHDTGNDRIEEIQRLIKKASKDNDFEDYRPIVRKLVAFYGGTILYGTGIRMKWEKLMNASTAFLDGIDVEMGHYRSDRRKSDCPRDLDALLRELVAAADDLPGDESRKHVDVCVALNQTVLALKSHRIRWKPEPPSCYTTCLALVVSLTSLAIGIKALSRTCRDPTESNT